MSKLICADKLKWYRSRGWKVLVTECYMVGDRCFVMVCK